MNKAFRIARGLPSRKHDIKFKNTCNEGDNTMHIWVDEEIWFVHGTVFKKYGPFNMNQWLYEVDDGGLGTDDERLKVQKFIADEIIEKELLS